MERSDNPVVLVVEDDPPVRELLQDVLQDEGYEVVAAHDGTMALQIVSSLKVDLITLDLDMPGLTGSELIMVLRKRKIMMPPVVIVTGQIPVKRAIKQMAQAVITKPFDIDEFVGAVLDLLPRRLPRAEARLRSLVQETHGEGGRPRKPRKGRAYNQPVQNGSTDTPKQQRSRSVGTEDQTNAEDAA